MQVPVLPLIEAAAFTLGCVAIHSLRRHAMHLTNILVAILIAVALVGITMDAMLNARAEADEYDMLMALEESP